MWILWVKAPTRSAPSAQKICSNGGTDVGRVACKLQHPATFHDFSDLGKALQTIVPSILSSASQCYNFKKTKQILIVIIIAFDPGNRLVKSTSESWRDGVETPKSYRFSRAFRSISTT